MDTSYLEKSIEVVKSSPRQRPKNRLRTRRFPFYAFGTFAGVVGGLVMVFYLAFLGLTGYHDAIHFKFFKYLFLFGVLVYGLYRYRLYLRKGAFFKNGILLGMYISFVAGLTLFVGNFLTQALAGDTIVFSKFNTIATTLPEFIVINAVIFFEVIVFGMISTFIALQLMKDKARAK